MCEKEIHRIGGTSEYRSGQGCSDVQSLSTFVLNLKRPLGSSGMWIDEFSSIRFQAKELLLNVTLHPLGSVVPVSENERNIS